MYQRGCVRCGRNVRTDENHLKAHLGRAPLYFINGLDRSRSVAASRAGIEHSTISRPKRGAFEMKGTAGGIDFAKKYLSGP
jgi:hypothetical protein